MPNFSLSDITQRNITDNSDERTNLRYNEATEYQCDDVTQRCIPRESLSIGNCTNASDESAAPLRCLADTEFRGEKNGRCISCYRVRDGLTDCLNTRAVPTSASRWWRAAAAESSSVWTSRGASGAEQVKRHKDYCGAALLPVLRRRAKVHSVGAHVRRHHRLPDG